MQLVAYGAQDIYLTGNPQITFFKVVYRRHTNFAMESIEQTINGTVDFGNKVSSTLSRKGDLVHKAYVELDITKGAGDICANFGSACLKIVDIEIGGQLIDKHYGHWLETWAELTEDISGLNRGFPHPPNYSNNDGTRNLGSKFQIMSGMGGIFGSFANNGKVHLDKMYVPLRFWFNNNAGLALPLVALQYHEVKINITFENESNLFISEYEDTKLNNAKLWVDYIYLDTDERRRFAQNSHEYLIEQLQFDTFGSSHTMNLNFNHPVKELIWIGKPIVGTKVSVTDDNGTIFPPTFRNNSLSTPTEVSNSGDWRLVLNGSDRMAERERNYFTRTQVWQHHSGYGGISVQEESGHIDSIAVYSFALNPEEHQPSGTCNFSRIDNAQLICKNNNKSHYVYAVNYNVLRVMSGMGGLAYSN